MYVFGKNVAEEMLASNKQINKVFISDKFNDDKILTELRKKNIKTIKVAKYELDQKVSGLHQGIVLDVPNYKYKTLEDVLNKEDSLFVILDHIEDPHNFAAIIRTCEAAGVDAIIIPEDRSVDVNGTVVKTSVGAIYNMPIIRVVNRNNTIEKLKDIGYWIVGTDMVGTAYTQIDYNMPICLIIGK